MTHLAPGTWPTCWGVHVGRKLEVPVLMTYARVQSHPPLSCRFPSFHHQSQKSPKLKHQNVCANLEPNHQHLYVVKWNCEIYFQIFLYRKLESRHTERFVCGKWLNLFCLYFYSKLLISLRNRINIPKCETGNLVMCLVIWWHPWHSNWIHGYDRTPAHTDTKYLLTDTGPTVIGKCKLT